MTTTQETRRTYSQAERLRIIEEHREAHDGELYAGSFLDAARHPEHSAHDYFDWDDTMAAHQHRLFQARRFIRVTIKRASVPIVNVSDGSIIITIDRRPAFVSPMESRNVGGGYYDATDTTLREECGVWLRQGVKRFGSSLTAEEVELFGRLMQTL